MEKKESAKRNLKYEHDPEKLQRSFNQYVKNYNEDFLFFLRRAASGNYNCLITSGRILKDLHEMVVFIHSATEMRYEVVPLPFTFRHGREYYHALGFEDDEIDNIHGFFDYVKKTFEKDFEQCMGEDTEFFCARR